MIDVKLVNDGDPLRFAVHIRQGGRETHHDVSITHADYRRLADQASPENLIIASFRFLLDRESPQSILPRFDVSVISHYFPEFERVLSDYLARPTPGRAS
jgi:hypothetical protein